MLALGGDRGSHGNLTRWYDYVASRSEVQQVCNKMEEAEKVSGDDEEIRDQLGELHELNCNEFI